MLGKVLVEEVLWGVGPLRSCEELPLCPMETMSAGSEMELLLAKANSISSGGSRLKKRKKIAAQLQLKKRVRICERNMSADSSVSG